MRRGALLAMLPAAAAMAGCGVGRAQDKTAPDFSASLRLANPAGCKFAAPGERAFERLLVQTQAMPPKARSPHHLALGGVRLNPLLRAVPVASYPGGMDFTARADFPAGSRWNGLSLTAMIGHLVVLPEVDGLAERSLVFAEPPERVQAALTRLGATVPIAPDWIALPETNSYAERTCGGSMQVREVDGGSELISSVGC